MFAGALFTTFAPFFTLGRSLVSSMPAVFNQKYNGNGHDFEAVVRGRIQALLVKLEVGPTNCLRSSLRNLTMLATGGKIRTALSGLEIAEQAVWVIESDGDTQGSAFFLEGVGLVTCAHCLDENPYVYHSTDHSKRFKVKVLKQDKHRDLAVLELPSELKNVIPLEVYEGAPPANGTDIILLGYPNHFAAQPVRVEGGK